MFLLGDYDSWLDIFRTKRFQNREDVDAVLR